MPSGGLAQPDGRGVRGRPPSGRRRRGRRRRAPRACGRGGPSSSGSGSARRRWRRRRAARAITCGQTRGSRSSTLVSMQQRCGPWWLRRPGSPTSSRSTLAWPSGSRPPAPTPIVATVIAGWGPQPVARVVSSAAPVGVHSSMAGAPAGPAYDGTPRSSSATAGGGTGSVPWAPLDRARADRDRAHDDRRGRRATANPAHTPTTSAIASRAPTSWKDDVERVAAVHRGLGHGEPLEDARPPGRGPRRRGRRASSRDRMSRQVRWWTESATSTWQRVAAKPSRDTASTRSVTGSGLTASTARLQHLEGYAGAEQRAEQHVAGGSRGGVDPDRHRSSRADRRATRAANTPAPYPLSMLTTVTPGRAGVEHRQQRGDAAERGAVADAGRHRDERDADQPADHGGQRALHAGDDDQAVGLLEPVADAEQPVEAGHADVGDHVDPGPVDPRGQRRLGGDRGVGGAGADDGDRAAARSAAGRAWRRGRPGRPRRRRPAACIASSESRVASTARSGWCSCRVRRIETTCSGVLPAP